jgi:hypothetical protein
VGTVCPTEAGREASTLPVSLAEENKASLSEKEKVGMTDNLKKPWPWPAELDARTAAPEYHRLLFENEHVRVLDAHVEAGETVPVHTHCWPGVLYILSVSDFVRRDPNDNVVLDTRGSVSHAPAGSAVWGDVLTPHTLQNVGAHELRNITVELKHLT